MTYSIAAAELLSAAQITFTDECAADLVLTDICLDSRKVSSNSVFCAFPGMQTDGRDFISQAVTNGAALILCEKNGSDDSVNIDCPLIFVTDLRDKVGLLASAFFAEPSKNMQVFGVTGTNGKTTCCYLLTQALEKLGMKAAMIGTIGVGASNHLSPISHTTPDPISIQRQLAEFRDQGVTQVCMEVSSHALQQGRVVGIEFFCTLYTNLSQDHLDYHGSMESYAAVKERLFTDFHSELCVVNVDDDLGARLPDVANSDFIARYSENESVDADVVAAEVNAHENGLEILIEGNGVEFTIHSSLVGLVNVPNLLLLATVLLALSTPVEEIQSIIAQLKPAPGRMELFSRPGHAKVVVDYAHTPDALKKALVSIREHCQGQLWCVFGCGGDRDRGKRPLMGQLAQQNADCLIVTNDNPRTEQPEKIAQEILAGMKASVLVELDRAAAINLAVRQAAEQDWVLIAGKGHEATQTIGQQSLPFSDREQVLRALEAAA